MISIIMVFRIKTEVDQKLWTITQNTINSLLKTADQDFELIVIDNGSHDPRYAQSIQISSSLWGGPQGMFPHIQGCRVLRFDEHVSLMKAWNEGYHQADGEFIMFANNDIVFLLKGWMTRLIDPFTWENMDVGITGIQHMSWDHFSFVEGSLFVLPGDLAEAIQVEDGKLFDEQFFYIGDVDLNRRVQDAGYVCIQVNGPPLQPEYLQHLGHQTIQSLAGTDEDYIAKSHHDRELLCDKYGYERRIND